MRSLPHTRAIGRRHLNYKTRNRRAGGTRDQPTQTAVAQKAAEAAKAAGTVAAEAVEAKAKAIREGAPRRCMKEL